VWFATQKISKWKLDLPSVRRTFDYRSISDVLLHIQYTSKLADSGNGPFTVAVTNSVRTFLTAAAESSLERGLALVLDPRSEFPQQWAAFRAAATAAVTTNPNSDGATLRLPGNKLRAALPFLARDGDVSLWRVRIVAEMPRSAVGAQADLGIRIVIDDVTSSDDEDEDEDEDEDSGEEGEDGILFTLSPLEPQSNTTAGRTVIWTAELSIEELGLVWGANGDEVGDWVLTVQGPGALGKARKLQSLQILVGYTLVS